MLRKIFGSKGKSSSGESKDSGSYLHAAAKSGDVKALAEALRAPECRIDALNGDGQTALSLAIGKGHEQIVAHLLDRGASVAVKRKHKSSMQTPRELAVEKGKKRIVELLDVAEAWMIKDSLFGALSLPRSYEAFKKSARQTAQVG